MISAPVVGLRPIRELGLEGMSYPMLGREVFRGEGGAISWGANSDITRPLSLGSAKAPHLEDGFQMKIRCP